MRCDQAYYLLRITTYYLVLIKFNALWSSELLTTHHYSLGTTYYSQCAVIKRTTYYASLLTTYYRLRLMRCDRAHYLLRITTHFLLLTTVNALWSSVLLSTSHYLLLTTYYSQCAVIKRTTHYASLFTTYYLLQSMRCDHAYYLLLLTTHYSLLNTVNALCSSVPLTTTRYSLLTTYYSQCVVIKGTTYYASLPTTYYLLQSMRCDQAYYLLLLATHFLLLTTVNALWSSGSSAVWCPASAFFSSGTACQSNTHSPVLACIELRQLELGGVHCCSLLLTSLLTYYLLLLTYCREGFNVAAAQLSCHRSELLCMLEQVPTCRCVLASVSMISTTSITSTSTLQSRWPYSSSLPTGISPCACVRMRSSFTTSYVLLTTYSLLLTPYYLRLTATSPRAHVRTRSSPRLNGNDPSSSFTRPFIPLTTYPLLLTTHYLLLTTSKRLRFIGWTLGMLKIWPEPLTCRKPSRLIEGVQKCESSKNMMPEIEPVRNWSWDCTYSLLITNY